MEITDLALATTLVAVVATAIACLVVTVHTFVRAAREARRESRPEGRLLYGTFDLQTAAPHDAVAERRATR